MLVWIGKRESDIYFSKDIFCYSITYWGSNQNGNISLHTTYHDIVYGSGDYINLVAQNMFDILSQSSNAQFLFYNNSQAKQVVGKFPELFTSIVGCNLFCHDWLRQKSLFRIWASNYCLIPPSTMLATEQCSYEYFKKIFPSYASYVVQADLSSGGEKTYVITENEKYPSIDKGKLYLVSPYLVSGNSYNAHVLITSQQVIVLSISLQLIHLFQQNLLFGGGDYSSRKLTNEVKASIISMCKHMGEVLKANGYRGVLGLDFISDGHKTYVIESNPRFQGSSLLLDWKLNEHLTLSLFDLHLRSFCEDITLDESVFPLEDIGSCLYTNSLDDSTLTQIPKAKYDIQNMDFSVKIYDSSVYDWMHENGDNYFL